MSEKDMELLEEMKQDNQHLEDKFDFITDIRKIVEQDQSPEEMKEKLGKYHDNDIADALEYLDIDDRKKVYEALDPEEMSEIMSYVDDAEDFLHEMGNETAADVIENMDADDAVDILEDLEDDIREQILQLVDEDARHDIDLIQSFDEGEIGSKMTTNYVVIDKHLSIKQAMKELVGQAAENDNIATIYVTDSDKYYGAIDLKELIVARDYQKLDDIIVTSYPYVYADEHIEDCMQNIIEYSEDSIPVVDRKKHLIGALTSQDIVELVDDELGEDYAKLAGLTAEEDLEESVMESMKKRIPWLMVLLVLGLCVSSVVGIFEAVVAQLAIIVCFQSLILDMSGNVGTQSLAVTIRVLMDEQLGSKQIGKLIWKEVRVGFANGVLLGVLSFLFIGLYVWLVKAKTVMFSYVVSGCIGVSLLLAMTVSSFVGTIIPIALKKMKFDPAVASGPLITTINDLVAVLTYYGLAWGLLINTLQLIE